MGETWFREIDTAEEAGEVRREISMRGASDMDSSKKRKKRTVGPESRDPAKVHCSATHAGVRFANYVVGQVQSVWQKEMGKKGPQKMTGEDQPLKSCLRCPLTVLAKPEDCDCRPFRLVPPQAKKRKEGQGGQRIPRQQP